MTTPQETSLPSFGARAAALVTAPGVEDKDANPAQSQEDRIAAQATRRIPMSAPQAKLATPSIPGYHLHWLNDVPGRINQAIAAGYSFVAPEETYVNNRDLAGDSAASGSSDMGSRVSVVVGSDDKGNEIRAYLMKLPQHLYDKDQKAAQQRVDMIDYAMRQGRQNPTNQRDDAQRYVKTVDLRTSFTR